ncbi:DUF4142 domain-containing protein [Sphingoaurantiacus capsulatus]|uniref:DUF4142 domain-containing protein n=1 Tax=Sphingoaurantiacus capsulatus TaxID=1771310 RepID=A0ABV7XC26_9SPHN
MKFLKNIAIASLVGSTALLGAGAAGAFQTAASTATSNQTAERMTPNMPLDMKSFIDTASSIGAFEVVASKLALERGVGGEVKTFAEKVIADHTAANDELTALIATMNPPMAQPKDLNGKYKGLFQTLNEAGPGNASTRAYVDSQRVAHNEAVALFTAYAQGGDNAQLQAYARKYLPALQAHLDHIRRIEAMR